MNIKSLIALPLLAAVLAACGADETKAPEEPAAPNEPQTEQTQQTETLGAEETKQLVNDYTMRERQADSASITSNELIVTEDGKETVYGLPDDEFFVSIAPFVSETHPCDIHSLTGCQGELVNEEFDVRITDEDGNTVLDETKQTEANGFIDLWLPRDHTYHVTIEQDGRTTESEISTFEGDNTCITTMQLS